MTLAYLKHEWNGVLDIFEFIGRSIYKIIYWTWSILYAALALVSFAVMLAFVVAILPAVLAVCAVCPILFFCWNTGFGPKSFGDEELVVTVVWWISLVALFFFWLKIFV